MRRRASSAGSAQRGKPHRVRTSCRFWFSSFARPSSCSAFARLRCSSCAPPPPHTPKRHATRHQNKAERARKLLKSQGPLELQPEGPARGAEHYTALPVERSEMRRTVSWSEIL